jgi:tripartite-type tricarboxylate transporter receptor subunit TctC
MVQTAQRKHRRIDRRTLLRRSAELSAVAAMGTATGAAVHPGLAEPGYPNRPVRIIVPYGPGGIADTNMRIVAERLSFRLGQQFIVDNRPGAGGIVAAKAVASSPPDGYVLELTGNGTAISAALFKQLPFDVVRDFTPIGITAFFDLVIVAKADGPLKSVGDIVAAARANPGKLNFGSITPREHPESLGGALQERRRHQCGGGDLPHLAGARDRARQPVERSNFDAVGEVGPTARPMPVRHRHRRAGV